MAGLSNVKPFKFLKSCMPKSLYARTLIILVVPLIVVMTGTLYIFIDQYLDKVTHRLANNIAGEISSMTEVYKSKTMTLEQLSSFGQEHYEMSVRIENGYEVKKFEKSTMRAIGAWFLEESLTVSLNVPFYVKLDKNFIYVDVILDNAVLHFETPRKRLLSRSTPISLLLVIILPVLMFIIAALFMKNQVRPLRRLASAADKFGKGLPMPDIRPEGATEVRQAALAFNLMRERLHRQIVQRTEMLAGVSHDLRTPLTRMELQLAMIAESPEVDGLKQDVKEMKNMVESFLAFARGDEPEKAVMTNVFDLLESVALTYGPKVTLPKRKNYRRLIRTQSMKRCFQNLLDNANKYASKIQIDITLDNNQIIITIEDNGPGIPSKYRSDVFKPFFRIDSSRNLDSGGSGLGLSIAQDVIYKHGGTIDLSDSSLGGLKVTIQIPC